MCEAINITPSIESSNNKLLKYAFDAAKTEYLNAYNRSILTACPTSTTDTLGRYYISDTANRCIFYWCIDGALVGSFQCPPGRGTVAGDNGASDICTQTLVECGGMAQVLMLWSSR